MRPRQLTLNLQLMKLTIPPHPSLHYQGKNTWPTYHSWKWGLKLLNHVEVKETITCTCTLYMKDEYALKCRTLTTYMYNVHVVMYNVHKAGILLVENSAFWWLFLLEQVFMIYTFAPINIFTAIHIRVHVTVSAITWLLIFLAVNFHSLTCMYIVCTCNSSEFENSLMALYIPISNSSQHRSGPLVPAVLCHVPQEALQFLSFLGVHYLAADYPSCLCPLGPHSWQDSTWIE